MSVGKSELIDLYGNDNVGWSNFVTYKLRNFAAVHNQKGCEIRLPVINRLRAGGEARKVPARFINLKRSWNSSGGN